MGTHAPTIAVQRILQSNPPTRLIRTAKLAAGEGRWGGPGGHEYGPGQTKRAGVHYYAYSQQREQKAYFWGVFGH